MNPRLRLGRWIARVGWELVVGMLVLVILAVIVGIRVGLGIAEQTQDSAAAPTRAEHGPSVW